MSCLIDRVELPAQYFLLLPFRLCLTTCSDPASGPEASGGSWRLDLGDLGCSWFTGQALRGRTSRRGERSHVLTWTGAPAGPRQHSRGRSNPNGDPGAQIPAPLPALFSGQHSRSGADPKWRRTAKPQFSLKSTAPPGRVLGRGNEKVCFCARSIKQPCFRPQL